MPENPRLKITDVRSVPFKEYRTIGVMEPAWDPGRSRPADFGAASFVEVHTDQGLTGIGPAVDDRLIPDVKEYLLGEDPFDIERHAHVLRYYAWGAAYHGTAGVDIALWDLIGKATGQPLYKLWGGDKDKVVPYASMILLSSPEERAEMALSLIHISEPTRPY